METSGNHVESMDQKELTLKAKGGISFKSKSLNADLFANATTSKTTINYMKYEPTTTRTNTIGVFGKVETKNFDISTVVSAMSVNETGFEDWEKADDKTYEFIKKYVGFNRCDCLDEKGKEWTINFSR